MSHGQALLERLAGVTGATNLAAIELEPDKLELRLDEAMARHTTLRLGGPADIWARPADVPTLAALLARCQALAVPVHFVGSGTNLLVRDGGLRGVVLNLGRINRVWRPDPDRSPELVEVEAGASTGRLLRQTTAWELGGVEFLGGVPGSVGGGLIMNAGTYLGEFTDVVAEVRSLDLGGAELVRDHAACGFRYRDSDLPKHEIVVGARLRLRPRPRAEIDAEVAALRKRRHEREPKKVPNNGSTFKNPTGEHAGRLIDVAGLKGARRGGAVVSPKHANWLVVDREVAPPCTAADMLELIEFVRAEVERVHGVRLETEVKIVGEG
ncbi:UDP-N-acetylenolpyruvoylglucosamine reductase [Enhygromyxa salina]|uniref:UDP-N-acetylenolpyruvoylglucosamine reductase n=1 Tax=Enhygromyxa salina TaxID=215803 RepID=A0A2S9XDH3_9BACT|nr:UDP-N-acetylmuramate dehydrogenase [Enhygromyxa salina]PRP90903.1 UDP-N-acetylenolpyruvoylglucosamine reductase [Enhygromyxa salina]